MKTIQHARTPLLLLLALTGLASAQLKTGSNPTAVAATSNFEVEATNGNKFIIGKATGAMTFIDGNQGAGKVLTSDANGLAAWATANQLSSIAITSLTSPSTYATGTMVYNTTAITDVPAGPVVWNGSKWLAVGSQNSIVTVSGTTYGGYDLTGLSSYTYDASSTFATSGNEPIDNTDAASDFPSASMATAMSALPNGGVIKIKLPSHTHSNAGSNIEYGLPEASAYVGKTYYMYIDWTQTASASCASSLRFDYVYLGSSSDGLDIIGGGTGASYALVGSSNVFPPGSGSALALVYISSSGYSTKPLISPVVKIMAVNANRWAVEYGIGSIYMAQ